MPFTPLHMGPGIVIKLFLQGSFSLLVFGWAQIVMDIQPLLAILSGAVQLHGFSHTYLGATLLAVFSAATGKSLAQFGLRWLRIATTDSHEIRWRVVIPSAFIGSYSHVALDSIMHADVRPFYPLSEANGLLGMVSVDLLQSACLYSGIVGGALYFAVRAITHRQQG